MANVVSGVIPGTTPTFVVTLKDEQSHLADTKSLRVDIRQQDVLITKEIDLTEGSEGDGIVINAPCNQIAIFLNQKESYKFLYKKGDIEIQVHGLMNDGTTAWKTYPESIPVGKTLSKEVIT